MFPNNYDISSVQPIVAASEGTTVFGDQRNVREEPRTYLGVQKYIYRTLYIFAFICLHYIILYVMPMKLANNMDFMGIQGHG